jgi:hypothetical protein
MRPQNDDLSSAWITGGNNPKRPRPEDNEPTITYTEADENYYRVVDIYGDQHEAKNRMRRGRKTNG